MTRPSPSAPTPVAPGGMPPLTVDAAGAAAMVGLSRSFWMRLHAEGRTPDPIRLGRRVLWRVRDIEQWVADGCRRQGQRALRGGRP